MKKRLGWKPTHGLAAEQRHPLAPLAPLEFFDDFDEMHMVGRLFFLEVGFRVLMVGRLVGLGVFF